MDRAALIVALGQPRRVAVSRRTWEAAAVLAGLRVAVNDRVRAEDRDRGPGKNWLADLWGVLGELIALRTINAIADVPVLHHPIDFARSVDAVDLTAQASDGPVLLEAKAHLLESGKDWFMVNRRARERSARRGAIGYLPVLGRLGAGRPLVGRLIRIDEMAAWGKPDKPLKDPAVGLTLPGLCERYLDCELPDAKSAIDSAPQQSSALELNALAGSAGAQLERWQDALPPLGGLRADTLVDLVQRLR